MTTSTSADNTAPRRYDYGRMLDDFRPGDIYLHPFELTVDASIVGPYMAGFIDATPLWSSDLQARALRLAGRPVPGPPGRDVGWGAAEDAGACRRPGQRPPLPGPAGAHN